MRTAYTGPSGGRERTPDAHGIGFGYSHGDKDSILIYGYDAFSASPAQPPVVLTREQNEAMAVRDSILLFGVDITPPQTSAVDVTPAQSLPTLTLEQNEAMAERDRILLGY